MVGSSSGPRLAEDAEVARVAEYRRGHRPCRRGRCSTRASWAATMRGASASSSVLNTIASLRNGVDQVQRNGGDGVVAERFAAHARRQLHGVALGALRQAQARAAVDLLEDERLAGVDQVRVADLVEVQAPQLGPAPRRAQEQPGDVPERVAALDGVDVGRVGGELGQRDAGLRDFLRRRAPLGGDRHLRRLRGGRPERRGERDPRCEGKR